MKYLKTYENENIYVIGEKLEQICRTFKEKLNLDEFIIYENHSSLYFRSYNEMNDFTFEDFSKLFGILTQLGCKWKYKERQIIVYFTNVKEEDLDLYLSANKYNL